MRPRTSILALLPAVVATLTCSDPAPATGSLIVTVAGLPDAAPAAVRVTGPGDFSQLVPATVTLEGLVPGAYVVTSTTVTTDLALYQPFTGVQDVDVVAGQTGSAAVSYALSSGTISLTVEGLPTGVVAQVRVTGNGATRIVGASGSVARLLPGSYTIHADTFTAPGGDLFGSAAPEQQVMVTASLVPVPVSVAYALASGSLSLTINGLTATVADAVTVTGPGGFSRSTHATTSYRGLLPGTYLVTAREFTSCPNLLTPAIAAQSFDIAVGQTTDAVVDYSSSTPSPGTLNLTIASLQVTQVVQNETGTLPIIAGRPALVRVFGIANQCSDAVPAVRLRLSNGDSLTIPAPEQAMRMVPVPGTFTTSWNALLPASVVQPGLMLSAAIDPDNAVAEASEGDNVYPPAGEQSAGVITVPPLKVTFIPVTSAGATGNVTPANTDEYLVAARQMLPLGEMQVTVGATFSSQVNLGNGTASAYQGILQEIELKRRTDSMASPYDGHYYGVVRPVAGITFVSYGGWAYIGGRSAVGMQVGWFNNQRQATELVAHELSHNFGRFHAPCGAAAGPDPNYPYPGGVTGAIGYDLWSATSVSQVVLRTPQSPDIMGYCQSPWISDYNYSHILGARGPVVIADAVPPSAPVPTLVLSGMVSPDSLRLDPVFQLRAHPSPPAPGSSVLEGFASDGTQLFRIPFAGEQSDHGDPNVRYFAMAVPLPPETASRLARVEVRSGSRRVARGSGGGVARLRATGAPGSPDAAGVRAIVVAPGTLEVAWDALEWPRVLVRDPATGSLLAVGTSGRARIATTLTAVELVLSDGTRSASVRATATRR